MRSWWIFQTLNKLKNFAAKKYSKKRFAMKKNEIMKLHHQTKEENCWEQEIEISPLKNSLNQYCVFHELKTKQKTLCCVAKINSLEDWKLIDDEKWGQVTIITFRINLRLSSEATKKGWKIFGDRNFFRGHQISVPKILNQVINFPRYKLNFPPFWNGTLFLVCAKIFHGALARSGERDFSWISTRFEGIF